MYNVKYLLLVDEYMCFVRYTELTTEETKRQLYKNDRNKYCLLKTLFCNTSDFILLNFIFFCLNYYGV